MASTKSTDAVLVALAIIVILAIIVTIRGGSWLGGGSGADGFAAGAAPKRGDHNPYAALHKQLDSVRGYRHDAYNQPPVWRQPHRLDRSGAYLKPEQIAEAEREQWFAATEADHSGSFNTELSQDAQTDTMQYHSAQPAIDYSGYITDLIVDPRTKDNHSRWVEEMKPWSGTAMTVDDMDEAMEATTHFTGLRRPQAIVQYNPLQLTESDTHTFASNAKFNFRG